MYLFLLGPGLCLLSFCAVRLLVSWLVSWFPSFYSLRGTEHCSTPLLPCAKFLTPLNNSDNLMAYNYTTYSQYIITVILIIIIVIVAAANLRYSSYTLATVLVLSTYL